MLVFGEGSARVPGDRLRARAREAAAAARDRASVLGALLAWGELATALLDHHLADEDERHPLRDELRDLGRAVGTAFVEALADRPVGLADVAGRIGALPVPSTLEARVAEGTAWYGLHPEAYVAAARRFRADERPRAVVVVGLRSIGTLLGSVVEATLADEGVDATSVAVRPRGHPFDRRPRLGPGLAAWLAERRDRWFLVVDEGPGLSGSSLTGAADALVALGVDAARIALLPAADPDPARFVNPRARALWPTLRRWCVPFEELGLLRGFEVTGSVGGGAWRGALVPGRPRALPLLERRKLLIGDDGIARFAGLGARGRATLARAERLHAEGFGPRPRGLVDAHLLLDRIPGDVARRPSPGLAAHALAYVRARARWVVDRAAPVDDLLALIEANADGLGGPGPAQRAAAVAGRDAPTVAIDGRLDLHEWVAGPRGWVKVDGVDHCADHTLVGCQDIAWDVAGLLVELGVPRDRAVASFQAHDPGLVRRLPLYEAAYAAFRLGYADLAARSVAREDRRAWVRARARYRAHLARTLA